MAPDLAEITLLPAQFGPAETVIARFGGLVATGFLYPSGVAGLRIENGAGHVVALPFHGQQIWDAVFLGRRLTMRSMFEAPVATRDYLANYGAFLIHCGAAAMGNPGPADTHALHGELPNAPYGEARLILGVDAEGPFMGLAGSLRHTIAFGPDYVARPEIRLHAGSARMSVSIEIENRKRVPIDLMYLAHVNFRPVDGGRLVDTVVDDRRDIAVRQALPPGFPATAEYLAFRDAVVADPSLHRTFEAGRPIDPELVMTMRCAAGTDGWAHALQIHPDGTADLVSHRPDQLDHGVRWMSRGADMDALGLMLPATADPDGLMAAREKGTLRSLAPGAVFRADLVVGALDAQAATAMEARIAAIRGGGA